MTEPQQPSAKILIIEDDASLLGSLETRLSAAGFAIISEKNGKAGLQTALQERPDLILTDLKMPEMDGMQMLDILRKDMWGKDVPVIILTNSDATDELLTKINTDHPSYYLIKTQTSLEDITQKIQELVAA